MRKILMSILFLSFYTLFYISTAGAAIDSATCDELGGSIVNNLSQEGCGADEEYLGEVKGLKCQCICCKEKEKNKKCYEKVSYEGVCQAY